MKATITAARGESPERIWERPMPGYEYILGADVAQGATFGVANERGDYSTMSVWKRTAHHLIQVAEMRTRADTFIFGQLVAAWGKWYNLAWINIERNYAHGPMAGLKAAEYPEYRWYRPTIHASVTGSYQAQWFFHKNKTSQRMLLDTLRDYCRERLIIKSAPLVQELSTLRRDDSGEVNTNSKDLVIACAMAVIADKDCDMGRLPVEAVKDDRPNPRDQRFDHAHWEPIKKLDPQGVGFEEGSDVFGQVNDGWSSDVW